MKKLQQVEEAKVLMKEAVDWSLFKWLWEKSAVRETADRADAALDRANRKVKAQWREEVREAYRQLVDSSHRKDHHERHAPVPVADSELIRVVRHVKDLDEKAHLARVDARQTFDEAERRLDTSLAREGCKKAIHSWNLHEKALREAEALVNSSSEASSKH